MLAREVLLAPLLASDGEHSTGVPKVEAVASEMKDIGLVAPREEPMVKESGVLAVAPREELLVTLKALCVCVCLYASSSGADLVSVVSEVNGTM